VAEYRATGTEARLRLNGLIRRLDGTNTYILTDDGQRASRSSTPR